MRLASAPVSWGVWERTVGRDDLVPAETLLETVRALGFDAIELGPPGYLSPELLGRHGVALAGGFAPLRFEDETAYREDIPVWLDPIVDMLVATGARGPVVLAGAEIESHPTPDSAYFGRVNDAVERCRARGVPVVFHHHAATYVESPQEIELLLEHSDVAICFDPGHALVGGGDPVEVARLCAGRIEHLHLKDVDPGLLARVRGGELSLDDAWADGIFCPFGEGAVDFPAILELFADFEGWTVLEQDRVAVTVADLPRVTAVEQRNLELVRAS